MLNNWRFLKFLPFIVLQRHNFLVLSVAAVEEGVCVKNSPVEGGQQSKMAQCGSKQDGLALYYDQFSFYSQKVVLVLHEKNLHFESKLVNLIKSEQYEPWFLKINPRGEVPVLQDTGKIIPDSARIIDYLEDNFSNEDTPRLFPADASPEIRQKILYFRQLLQKTPEGSVTSGAMLHPDLLKNPKTPFFGPVRKALASADKNAGENLRAYAEKNPEAREVLLEKAKAREEKYNSLLNVENYTKILDTVDNILKEVEEELAKHVGEKEAWWLCSDQFTVADCELTIVLVRLNQLGLDHRFWSGGKRPNIEKYFDRVQKRDAFKKAIPGTFTLFKTIALSNWPFLTGAVAIVVGIVAAKKVIS